MHREEQRVILQEHAKLAEVEVRVRHVVDAPDHIYVRIIFPIPVLQEKEVLYGPFAQRALCRQCRAGRTILVGGALVVGTYVFVQEYVHAAHLEHLIHGAIEELIIVAFFWLVY